MTHSHQLNLLFVLDLFNVIFGISIFSPSSIYIREEVTIATCYITRITGPPSEFTAVCGYQGPSCSIAVYRNQSQADLEKSLECGCLQDVFPYVDRQIPGKYFIVHTL